MGERILVCGGRDYDDRSGLYIALDEFRRRRPVAAVITGGARGADSMADDWAAMRGIPIRQRYHADWRQHGRSAGPIRNRKMLAESKPTVVIAFPGGRGTADMVAIARKAGVEVIEVGAA